MLRIARDAMAATSVTVLSDYRKGVLAGDIPARLIGAARQAGRRIIVDLRGNDYARYAGADVLLTTRRDLARACSITPDTDEAFAAAAAAVRRVHDIGAVMVTSAEAGITLVHEGGSQHSRSRRSTCSTSPAPATPRPPRPRPASPPASTCRPPPASPPTPPASCSDASAPAPCREQDLLAVLAPQRGALQKITTRDVAADRVERWRRRGLRIGLVNGCFDPLRAGHIHLLEQARAACDRLVVGSTTTPPSSAARDRTVRDSPKPSAPPGSPASPASTSWHF